MPQLQIDRLAYGGSGFGRLNGKACFIPYTAPGDVAEIRIEKEKKSYCEAVLEKLLSPSAFRVLPICPLFTSCGGCNWQHISYQEQCKQKEQIFADTLWRTARIDREKIKPILTALSPFAYRQRIQLKVSYKGGRLSLGFHRRSSHHVIDIKDRCEIAAEPLNLAMPAIRELIYSAPEPGNISQVELASSSDGSVSALFHYSGSCPEMFARHLAATQNGLSTIHSVSMLAGNGKRLQHIHGLEKLKYLVPSSQGGELELCYSPDSFSQVNFAQNRAIIETVLEFCSKVKPVSVLDLYCGNGNFSLPLAGMAGKVLGFEYSAKSVFSAEYNAAVNGIKNASYVCMDSAAGIDRLVKDSELCDLVIMDPPRAGADEVSRIISSTGASHLIYVSCDPPTLGRDLATLATAGFEVITVQPVDMFPQTYHLESVTFLKAI